MSKRTRPRNARLYRVRLRRIRAHEARARWNTRRMRAAIDRMTDALLKLAFSESRFPRMLKITRL